MAYHRTIGKQFFESDLEFKAKGKYKIRNGIV